METEMKKLYNYIWIDRNGEPRVKYYLSENPEVQTYDASSTHEATINNSSAMLTPISTSDVDVICSTPFDYRDKLKDLLKKIPDTLRVGIEQEFYIDGNPELVRDGHYCKSLGYGHEVFMTILHDLVREGLPITGGHQEVGSGQYEIQLSGDPLDICDQIVYMRHLIQKSANSHNKNILFGPKPFRKASGSGMHIHISYKDIPKLNIRDWANSLQKAHSKEWVLKYYGDGNDKRLNGECETCHIDECSIGQKGDRSAAIRVLDDRLEDRRVGANCVPYKAVYGLLKTIYRGKI